MMPPGDEARVQAAFCTWLRNESWGVRTDVGDIDVVAERHGVQLVAEVKGITTSPGTDVDTGYGQLLRRIPAEAPSGLRLRFALVVPTTALPTALRVPWSVREVLGIEIFVVDQHGAVTSA